MSGIRWGSSRLQSQHSYGEMEGSDGECSEAYKARQPGTHNSKQETVSNQGKGEDHPRLACNHGTHGPTLSQTCGCVHMSTHAGTHRQGFFFFFLRKKKLWIFICSHKWELKFREAKEFSQKQTWREDHSQTQRKSLRLMIFLHRDGFMGKCQPCWWPTHSLLDPPPLLLLCPDVWSELSSLLSNPGPCILTEVSHSSNLSELSP